MDKGNGFLTLNNYDADKEDKYVVFCRLLGVYSIVVRHRFGESDVEWNCVNDLQFKVLRAERESVVRTFLQGLYARYSPKYLEPDRYSVITGNDKLVGLAPADAIEVAKELSIFLQSMLFNYERRGADHEK